MLYIKALHIIFVVTWFAGLFYIVRLFIYYKEALDKPEEEQKVLLPLLQTMQKRLWFGITWPSMVLTLIFGTTLLYQLNWWGMPFMQLKLAFVAGLCAYHFYCHKLYLACKNGTIKQSSTWLRVWNEVATVFLIAIVFIIVCKNTLDWVWGMLGLIIFSILIMLAIRLYKKIRERESVEK